MSTKKILMIGAGEVAINLAVDLVGKHKRGSLRLDDVELTFIEKNKDATSPLKTQIDGQFYVGDGTDPELLLSVMESDDFDFVIALTNNDHVNMIACLMVKKIAAELGKALPKTVARIKNTYYDNEDRSRKSCNILEYFQIDHVIYLEKAWAESSLNAILYPQLKRIQSIYHDQIYLVCIEIDLGSPLANATLTEFRTDEKLTIAAIKPKDSETLKLPKSDEKIHVGDQVFLFLPKNKIRKAFKLLQLGHQDQTKVVIISDHHQLTQHLIKQLIDEKVEVVSMVSTQEIAEKVEDLFGGNLFTSLCGNPLVDDFVNEEISNQTILITASENDVMNITIGFKKRKKNPLKTFVLTKHDEHDYQEMTQRLDLEHLESPKEITVKRLIEYLHIELRDTNFHFILDTQEVDHETEIEAKLMMKEFRVEELSNLAGVALKDIKSKGFPDQAVICLVRRNEEYLMPSSKTELQVNDHLMIVGLANDLKFEESLGLISEGFKSSDEIEQMHLHQKEKKKKKFFWII
jgi:trk system potassium uptake protein TrkA